MGLGCNPSAAQVMYSLISYIISLRHSFPSVKWGQYVPCLTHLIDRRIKNEKCFVIYVVYLSIFLCHHHLFGVKQIRV